jgi:D-alanyl-lipoteichoic acid acyltransferase DltB (MBOAT superfamily)
MNASALLMILVCKYSLLAYALEDGSQPIDKLSPEQIRNRVTQPVGFLDFMGYINFLPTSLIGPPFEYNDFKHFMNREECFESVPSSPLLKLVAKTLVETVCFAGIYVLGDIYFPLRRLHSD